MKKESFISKLSDGLKKLSLLNLSSLQFEQLFLFHQYLFKWNKKINLTSHEEEESIEKNILDCLTLLPFVKSSHSILDIGSGAGFPGLVLKIAFPHLKLSLLEVNQKKSAFLEFIIQELAFEEINVVSKRLEEKLSELNFIIQFDTIVSRATIPPENFFKLISNFLIKNTKFILMIGKSNFGLPEKVFDKFILEKKFFYALPFSNLERANFVFKKK